MLLELSIRNFAIIKEVTISFRRGLNILTGETGAGKSIIIDALGLLLGERGSVDFVRHGEKRAEVEGMFELPESSPALDICEHFGIPVDSDRILIIRRELSLQGKNVIRINGHLATLVMLRELGPWLVQVHGQHDAHALLQGDRHIEWLDAFGHDVLSRTKQEVAKLYEAYRKAKQELARMAKNERELVQRIDLLEYQLQEIEAAHLQPGEEEVLQQLRKKGMNAEKIVSGLQDAYHALSGDQRGLDWLGHAMAELERLLPYDESLQPVVESIQQAFYQVEDAVHTLRQLKDRQDFDPAQMAEVEQRLHLIQGLKRKYGKSVDEILQYAAQIQDELDEIRHYDNRLQQLEGKLQEVASDLAVEAGELSALRKQLAGTLSAEIERQLRDLHMERARFAVDIKRVEAEDGIEVDGTVCQVNEWGIDHVQFLIAPNPGEPLKPLSKVASGGELSRIMLAIKTILADADNVDTLIFDEVDTGVSGRAAQSIAEKLAHVARHRQVLCITHLPQVASMADEHYLIHKEVQGEETVTKVTLLSEEDRISELARMLGGAEVTDTTRQHAKEMIQLGKERKAVSMI